MNNFAAAMLAVELVDRRDTLRRLLGPSYSERTKTAQTLIQSIVNRTGKPILNVAQELCVMAMKDGHEEVVNTLVAAAVDLCEASAS